MATTCCKKCGRKLATTAQWCPDCGTPLGRTVRCRSCGNEIPGGWNLGGQFACHHCGATGPAAYGYFGLWIFLGGVLVLILIFGLFYYFGYRPVALQQEERLKQMKQMPQP